MIKKTLVGLVALISLCANAQTGTGSWKIYQAFTDVSKIYETSEKVFYLSEGSLYSYDKETDESYSYGIDNIMSDSGISDIFYNPDGKYVVVTYDNANIDLIYESGKKVNMPDIKDAVLTVAPVINNVSFAPGKMLVSTNFGLVLYDDEKHEVIESGIYYVNIDYAIMTDDYIVASLPDNKIGIRERSRRLNNYDYFTQVSTFYPLGMFPLTGNKFLGLNGDVSIRIFDCNKDGYTAEKIINFKGAKDCYAPASGKYVFYNSSQSVEIDTQGNAGEITALPSEVAGQKLASLDFSRDIWAGNSDGVAYYTVSDGSATQQIGKIKPESMTFSKVGRIYASQSGKIYFNEYGNSHYSIFSDWRNTRCEGKINQIENGRLKDITPHNLTLITKNMSWEKNDGVASNIFNIVEDPEDPDTYYFPAMYEGVFKITDGEQASYYNKNNALPSTWTTAIDIDGQGNLWTLHYANSVLQMLPAASRKKEQASADEWIAIDTSSIDSSGGYRNAIIVSVGNFIYFSKSYYDGIGVYDFKGTLSTSDDECLKFSSFIDQDGKEMSFGNVYSMAEDMNGRIWVGHDGGVFEINNPSQGMDPNMRVNHIKVPRNDGTNYADYLLDGEAILSIAVDPSNRKWLATANSGVYLVSADGSQILEHYTTDNSYLPTNKVYAVACDPTSNAVYFGTSYGLIQYNSSSSPAADDYSDVYAYPNPVRPEYTGWITVKGLMDNSLVKIADTAGNVFFSGVSQGGMITWDGCDRSGQRVKTGVYFVFASQNEDGVSSGAVTKILVVK